MAVASYKEFKFFEIYVRAHVHTSDVQIEKAAVRPLTVLSTCGDPEYPSDPVHVCDAVTKATYIGV